MRILIIGDSCIDVFVYGTCERLCPDAPVPILVPTKTVENGGMAKNVYDNVKSIYEKVDLMTNKKIITKTRYVDEKTNQMMVRVDSENTFLDRISGLEKIPFQNYEIVIISDYCKGFLNKEDIRFICEKHKNVFIDTKKY